MNYIKDIQLKQNENFNVIIEILKGTNSKYELVDGSFDKVVEVRKVVGKYPFYYGCFPQTLAGDNDPLDMILLSNKKRHMLDIVDIVPIGVIKTIDNEVIDTINNDTLLLLIILSSIIILNSCYISE